MDQRRSVGLAAEQAAAEFLAKHGLAVVARNVRLPEGEIDLVCRERNRWVFVEVKCRRASWGDAPGAAGSWAKRRRIVRLAQHWLKWRGVPDAPSRFDVVEVTIDDGSRTRVRHIPAAFDASGIA